MRGSKTYESIDCAHCTCTADIFTNMGSDTCGTCGSQANLVCGGCGEVR